MPTNLPPQLQSRILGTQANLWTEQVPNLKHAEYMIFPRECALAEVAWSDKNSRDWDDFQSRLKVDEQRLDKLGVNYRHDTSAQLPAIPSAGDRSLRPNRRLVGPTGFEPVTKRL